MANERPPRDDQPHLKGHPRSGDPDDQTLPQGRLSLPPEFADTLPTNPQTVFELPPLKDSTLFVAQGLHLKRDPNFPPIPMPFEPREINSPLNVTVAAPDESLGIHTQTDLLYTLVPEGEGSRFRFAKDEVDPVTRGVNALVLTQDGQLSLAGSEQFLEPTDLLLILRTTDQTFNGMIRQFGTDLLSQQKLSVRALKDPGALFKELLDIGAAASNPGFEASLLMLKRKSQAEAPGEITTPPMPRIPSPEYDPEQTAIKKR